MISLKYWHRLPSAPRIYIDGLTNQHWRGNKVYAHQLGESYALESQGATNVQYTEAQIHCQSIGPLWKDLMRACNMTVPNDAPLASEQAADRANTRRRLEDALQVHVAAAVRAARIQFRNGLAKAEIIDLCCNAPLSQLLQVLQALNQLQAGQNPRPAPAPQSNPFDWDDEELPPALAQTPPAQTTPTPAAVDLSAYALRSWTTDNFASTQTVAHLATLSKTQGAILEKHAAALSDLQSRRPVEYHIPGQPTPYKSDKLTHAMFSELLDAIASGEHVLLVGPAGSGKTTHVQMAAEILNRRLFKSAPISHTGEILGYTDAHGRYVRTSWRGAYESGNSILLADEFDASCSDAPLAANPILDKSDCAAFPDGLVFKGAGFSCVLGTNTDGSGATMQYPGRIRMDGAFRDRFAIIQWGYDPRIEESMAGPWQDWRRAVQAVREFADKRGILDTVATPRAIQRGRIWLDAGKMTRERICEREFKLGALVECWRDILTLPPVASFIKRN